MDNARDLSKSPSGPWCPEDRIRPLSKYMLPVIQHRDYLAPWNGITTAGTSPEPRQPWQAEQNACLLPFQYGEFLRKETMLHDALYTLSDVFRLSAASEGQFLNLAHDLIEHEMEVSRDKGLNQASILNLRYLRKILDHHITSLTETVLLLADRDQLEWPTAAPGSVHRTEADRMASVLLRDFTHLRQRAERFSRSCQEGIQSLANDAAFQESTKAVANAARVERLTLLATVFVPLSFTCSLFGMNFAVFGQGDVSIWIFFPVAAGIVAVAFFSWYVAVPSWWPSIWARLLSRRP